MRWRVACRGTLRGPGSIRARGLRAVRGAIRRARFTADAQVCVSQATGSVEGRALGADRDGALRVEVGARVERFLAGDVTLRSAAGVARVMLLVDIGNSRVKWARSIAASWECRPLPPMPAGRWTTGDARCSRRRASTTCSWQASPVKPALRCSPRQHDSRPASPLQFVATSREAGGVRNAYPEPRLLGVDRWLAAIARLSAGSWRVLRRRHRHRRDAGRCGRRRTAPRRLHRAGTGTDDAIAVARDFATSPRTPQPAAPRPVHCSPTTRATPLSAAAGWRWRPWSIVPWWR